MGLSVILNLKEIIGLRVLIKRGLVIGKNCFIGKNVNFDWASPDLIRIGDNCTVSDSVIILTHDASMKRHIGYTKVGAVTIGNTCFIGKGAILLPGVHIGNNVVVGAGSVVTHDVLDNCVVAGNPAKVIKTIESFIVKHSANLNPEFYLQ